jgi:hypothetical protein
VIERRKAARESGPFPGVLNLYNRQSVACTVVNISEGGAKLRLRTDMRLPKEFSLTIPARSASWLVRVAWQQGPEIGVFRI